MPAGFGYLVSATGYVPYDAQLLVLYVDSQSIIWSVILSPILHSPPLLAMFQGRHPDGIRPAVQPQPLLQPQLDEKEEEEDLGRF